MLKILIWHVHFLEIGGFSAPYFVFLDESISTYFFRQAKIYGGSCFSSCPPPHLPATTPLLPGLPTFEELRLTVYYCLIILSQIPTIFCTVFCHHHSASQYYNLRRHALTFSCPEHVTQSRICLTATVTLQLVYTLYRRRH